MSCNARLLPSTACPITSSRGLLSVTSSCLLFAQSDVPALSCCRPLLRSLLQILRVLSRRSYRTTRRRKTSVKVTDTITIWLSILCAYHIDSTPRSTRRLRNFLPLVQTREELLSHSTDVHPKPCRQQAVGRPWISTARPDSTSVSLHFTSSSLFSFDQKGGQDAVLQE